MPIIDFSKVYTNNLPKNIKLESKAELKRLHGILKRPGFKFKFKKNFFEDELDETISYSMIQECILDFLEEEIEKKVAMNWRKIHYEYYCPHCGYRSRLFYRICLHIVFTKTCSEREEGSPCYPINKCYTVIEGVKRSVIT